MAVLGRYIPGLLLSYLIRKYGMYAAPAPELPLLLGFLATPNSGSRKRTFIFWFTRR